MATVPKGPGQPEVTGDLRDARDASAPGTYRDPESGKELEVSMGSGADALVRMGWQYVRPYGADSPTPPARDSIGHADEEPVLQPAPQDQPAVNPQPASVATPPVDDADQVEEQQDNAPGHKSEEVDGPPGVPAGDPEKLADETDKKKK